MKRASQPLGMAENGIDLACMVWSWSSRFMDMDMDMDMDLQKTGLYFNILDD